MLTKWRLNALILILLQVFRSPLFSQNNEEYDIHFYLLTYSPGNELYSTFGHSSIRYVNNSDNIDIVYNYGTFDFNDPDFYAKFIKGKLNYQLSRIRTKYVIAATKDENRRIYQNELIIKGTEKIALLNALENNYLPENRYYRYEFLYDNCATRIDKLIDSVTKSRFIAPKINIQPVRFNQLISGYLRVHPWANLGFNLITGMQVLKKATAKEQQFLPIKLQEYQSLLIDNSSSKKLLEEQVTFLNCNTTTANKNRFFHIIFLIILILWSFIRVAEFKTNAVFRWADWIVFWPPIVLGVILSGLWMISEHQIFAWNYNLLWANPLLILLFIPRLKTKIVLNVFFLILFVLSIILTIFFKGLYIPVIVLILIQASRLKIQKVL